MEAVPLRLHRGSYRLKQVLLRMKLRSPALDQLVDPLFLWASIVIGHIGHNLTYKQEQGILHDN